jgi:transcription antitermination protein NusB
MLSRRHLRIRVMQALYAWHQSDNRSAVAAETELVKGTERMYDLYLQLLSFYTELAHQEEVYYADLPASALTGERKKAVRYLSDSVFIKWLGENPSFQKMVKDRKISWQADQDAVKKAFFEMRKMPFYKKYIEYVNPSIKDEIDFAKHVAGDIISNKEFVRHTLEEKNIYWAEGFDVINAMIVRTIESGASGGFQLSSLYKDEEEDLQFMKDLLQKTIAEDESYTKMIAERTESWDTDRIALVDILLMKMALCEILHLSNIPVKVSINEYIDISKDYSTPNSKGFINGVIDNIVISLKKEGRIVKTGRGLME